MIFVSGEPLARIQERQDLTDRAGLLRRKLGLACAPGDLVLQRSFDRFREKVGGFHVSKSSRTGHSGLRFQHNKTEFRIKLVRFEECYRSPGVRKFLRRLAGESNNSSRPLEFINSIFKTNGSSIADSFGMRWVLIIWVWRNDNLTARLENDKRYTLSFEWLKFIVYVPH